MPMLIDAKQYQPQSLREYQQAAVSAVRAAWDEGEPAPLAALATGGGKTTIMAELLRQTVDPRTMRALVIAHTQEIIGQIQERIANQFGGELDTHFEVNGRVMPGIGVVMGESDTADARIVVATRQSLHKKRLAKALSYGAFDVIVIDEAHHAAPGTTYLDIVEGCRAANPAVKLVGFTATPKRADGHALEALWSKIVYQWLIPDGISAGYLVPVTRIKVTTEADVSAIRTQAGDYVQTKLVSVLKTANWIELAEKAYHQHIAATDRLCLAFFPSVEMSEQFAARLRAGGVKAEHLDGETPKDKRLALLRDFSAGRISTIVNFGVLTEGFDAPATGAILLARPTRSQTLFTQIIGRGLRPYPGKHDCLLIDLAVTDTRALEVGTLMGRMSTCKACSAQYYAGMKACPQCGAIPTWQSRARDGAGALAADMTGGALLANYEALFENAYAAWHTGADGFFSCTLSFEDGAFLIVPPLEDNYYRLAHVPKDVQKPISFIARNDDLAALMLDADQRVRSHAGAAGEKHAAWREHPASMAQINLLGKLGVHVPEGLSKGAASQLLTHAIAVKRLLQE